MQEKLKTSSLSFSHLYWLLRHVLKASPFLATGWLLFILVTAGVGAAELLVLRETVNALIAANSIGSAIPWLTTLCILFFTLQMTSVLRPLLREKLRIKAGFALQHAALKKTGSVQLEAFDNEDTHNLITRVVAGGDFHAIQLMQNGLSLIEFVPILLTSVFILGAISVWVPIIIVSGVLLLRVFEVQLGAQQRHFEVENTRHKRLADYYTQLLTERRSAAETRLWGISENLIQRWHETLAEYLKGRLNLELRTGIQGLLYVLIFIAVLAAALLVTSLLQGRIEAGLAALVMRALWNIGTGMNSVQHYTIGFVQHAGYGKDLQQLLETFPDEEVSTERPLAAYTIQEGIDLQDVVYRYPGADTDALTDVNMRIYPGEIIALVGENGAGKTTLAHILAGLRSPTAGHVTIDGRDVSTIPQDTLRSACTMVFQQPARYPAILRENLALDRTKGSDEHAKNVLTQVGLASEAVPLDGLLGPEFGGVDLSGGEWQRVGIARSLMKESEFIIFDEPTASLDPLAELEIFERFVELVGEKTAVLIAHRLGPTRFADRVIVLEKGRLVEAGTPADLLETKGKYAQMFALQSEWYQ